MELKFVNTTTFNVKDAVMDYYKKKESFENVDVPKIPSTIAINPTLFNQSYLREDAETKVSYLAIPKVDLEAFAVGPYRDADASLDIADVIEDYLAAYCLDLDDYDNFTFTYNEDEDAYFVYFK